MITYAAKLRMHLHPSFHSIGDYKARKTDNIKRVNDRVMEVLKLMGLLWCKDRLITERPTTRGTLGGELRKLSIAVEIINLPPVIILDDITTGLDAFVSSQIMSCLTTLTEKGHTVICTLQKPPAQVFNQVNMYSG
jgi:ABC-type multidrug transport system ATPase subunit